MKIRSVIAAMFIVGLAGLAVACGDSSTAASSVTSVSVTGAAPAVGATSQFTATATLSSGSSQDVTSQAAWSSSNTSAATVSGSGVVTAVSSGAAVITATYSSVIGSEAITVP
jgi:uncharacterized protein YjdB